MATLNRAIESEFDRAQLLKLLTNKRGPYTVSITDGKCRTTQQNRTQHMWMQEIAEQLGDRDKEDVRGECKLILGVPILRAENDAFRMKYDAMFKPLPYPVKLEFMKHPFDFAVTRIMTTKQKTRYLEAIIRHYGEQGVVLTIPDDLGLDTLGRRVA